MAIHLLPMPASSPRPVEIVRARKVAGLTQTQAGELIHASMRAWQQWESGDRQMHPAFFELFLIKSEPAPPSG